MNDASLIVALFVAVGLCMLGAVWAWDWSSPVPVGRHRRPQPSRWSRMSTRVTEWAVPARVGTGRLEIPGRDLSSRAAERLAAASGFAAVADAAPDHAQAAATVSAASPVETVEIEGAGLGRSLKDTLRSVGADTGTIARVTGRRP